MGRLILKSRHRVLCGDCRDAAAWDRLLGGARVDLVVTDPPYGLGGYAGRSGRHDPVEGDDQDVSSLLRAIPIAPHRYVWCEWKTYPHFKECLGEPDALIVWGKPWQGMGRGYRRQHEFCLYFGDLADTDKTDLWLLNYEEDGVTSTWQRTEKCQLHPTQKPISVFAEPMRNHPSAITIADGFLGSGTTLIAAESPSRRCFGIEISPAYVDVICRRYAAKFPNQPIVRESDGMAWGAEPR